MKHSSIQTYLQYQTIAIQHLGFHQIIQAKQALNKALQAYPIGYKGLLQLGHLQLEQKNYGKAQQDYTIAIQAKPYFSLGYCSRFFSHLRKQQWVNGLADINAAISCELMGYYFKNYNIKYLDEAIINCSNNLQALNYRKAHHFLKQNLQLYQKDKKAIQQILESHKIDVDRRQYISNDIPFFQLKGSTKCSQKVNNFQQLVKLKLQFYQKLKKEQQITLQFEQIKSQQQNIIAEKLDNNKQNSLPLLQFTNMQNRTYRSPKNSIKSPKYKKDLKSPLTPRSNSQKQKCLGCINNLISQQQTLNSYRSSTNSHFFKEKQTVLAISVKIQELNLHQPPKNVYRYCQLYYNGTVLQTQFDYAQSHLSSWERALTIQINNKNIINKLCKLQIWQIEKQKAKLQLIATSQQFTLKIGRIKSQLRSKFRYIGYVHINIKKQNLISLITH